MFNNQPSTTMKFSLVWKSATVLAVAAVIGLSGCSSSTTGPDPNLGKKALVIFLSVNPGFSNPVVFYDGTTPTGGTLGYGVIRMDSVQIGSRTITIKGTDGTDLASATI